MKFSPTIILLLFIVDIVIIFVLLMPKYQDFDRSISQYKAIKVELENFQENFNYLKSLNQKLEEKKDLVSKVDAILPDSMNSNQSQLIYFLEGAAEDNGGVITNISFSEPKPYREENQNPTAKSKIYQRELSFEIVAPYSGFVSFLEKIEKSSLFIKINSIDISKTNIENLLSFNVKGQTFLYKK